MKICAIDGCGKPYIARGWCHRHYKRWQIYGDPVETDHSRVRGFCSIAGCSRPMAARGWCGTHYSRWQRYGDPEREPPPPTRRSTWRKNNYGYMIRYWPEHPNASASSGVVAQHVAVMSEHLGRPLVKGETVHHKNGVRDDNRIENLELWLKAHPPGQRVAELVPWAREILDRYEQQLGVAF